ncbi:MAG: hypothetical protein FWF54_05990 [Candidatus Azobacteroides sp.]|nr:hypothetical protein [Candidatus Azobacteroides sp.]
MEIIHLKHDKIDFLKYDYCIENSSQGTVYAMSWYLNVVSPGWDVLMADNYSYVMPIPLKKKCFFKYIVQPMFCQQLGVFSLKLLTADILRLFIRNIPYRYYNLQFNTGNIFDNIEKYMKRNYTLNLNESNINIKIKYSNNCFRNLKKAKKECFIIHRQMSKDVYLKMIVDNGGNRPIKHFISLWSSLITQMEKNAKIEIWGVSDIEQNLFSCSLFLQWKNKFYYLVPISTIAGKQKQSMSFLLDSFIQEYAQTNSVLDFEGSSIPGIARFYEGFGPEQSFYPQLIKDCLIMKIYAFFLKH